MFGDHRMKRGDPIKALGQPSGCEPITGLVHQMDIMMSLSPIIAHKHNHRLLLLRI